MPLNESLESELEALLKHYYLYMKQCEIAGDSKISHTAVKGAINSGTEFHAQITNKILALIQSELKKQREDIRSKLPEKRTAKSDGSLNATAVGEAHRDGYNQAIQDITKILDS